MAGGGQIPHELSPFAAPGIGWKSWVGGSLWSSLREFRYSKPYRGQEWRGVAMTMAPGPSTAVRLRALNATAVRNVPQV
jgi:hypothetical protein